MNGHGLKTQIQNYPNVGVSATTASRVTILERQEGSAVQQD